MSANHDSLGYSVFRVFIILFVLTVLEVAWGLGFHDAHRIVLWGGLLVFAFAKGALIFMYFMHMKYEKVLVWSLVVPTIPLIGIILIALMPDLSFNSQRDHPVGRRLDGEGNVVDMITAGKHDQPQGSETGAGGH
jgi:cytochrome c oxidase subunit IV